jgi:hypothetical protein
MEVCWHSADSSLFKSRPPGVGRGHNRGNHFCMCLYRKNL